MADDEDSVRLSEKSVADAMIPAHPISTPEISKNKTPEIDVYANRPAKANGSQQHSVIKQLIFNSKGVKKSANETLQVDEYEYFHQLEEDARSRLLPDYIEKVQKGFTIDMRSIFVDWAVKIAEKIKLRSDLIHLTVSCIDRYLSVNAVDRQRLQLLGVSSMLICLKYDYKGHPCANDLCKTSGTKCTKLEVVKMEYEILKSLEFEMGYPTVKTFLRKFTRVSQEEDKILISESGYEPAKLKECVLILHDLQLSRRGGSLLEVREKYKRDKFRCVADFPTPSTIPTSFLL